MNVLRGDIAQCSRSLSHLCVTPDMMCSSKQCYPRLQLQGGGGCEVVMGAGMKSAHARSQELGKVYTTLAMFILILW